MPGLTNKRILVGVTGGIAAYKSADLIRRLREAGADARVIMTQGAEAFITPLTLQAVSGRPIHQYLLDKDSESGMGHIELARWADAVVVAPASANFIARLAQGRADDLLTAVCLATAAPVAVAPAMNQQMWENGATQENLALLERRGVHRFGPGVGDQACGEVGPGRMLEPVELVEHTIKLFATGVMQQLKIMITAGPTWEAIDPVRGLSNRSSGKMGYALATAAIEAGAQVVLVSGPTALAPPERAQYISVTSAREMYDTVHKHIEGCHIFIGVAAVADYRPETKAREKIKKNPEEISIKLIKNPDILASIAALAKPPFTVGFAAETRDLEKHAQAKLADKKLDLVVANPVDEKEGGFGADENRVTLVERGHTEDWPLQNKNQLARKLIQHIAKKYYAKHSAQDTRHARR